MALGEPKVSSREMNQGCPIACAHLHLGQNSMSQATVHFSREVPMGSRCPLVVPFVLLLVLKMHDCRPLTRSVRLDRGRAN